MKKNIFIIVIGLIVIVLGAVLCKRSTAYTANTENLLTAGDNQSKNSKRLVKEYPELRISIDAACPEFEEKDIPCISAHASQEYYNNMVQNFFLKRFPEAQKTGDNEWTAADAEGTLLGSMILSDSNRLNFLDTTLDVNSNLSEYVNKYLYFTDTTLCYPDGAPYTADTAIEDTIQALTDYTDFELIPCSAYSEQDSETEQAWYRIDIQLSYNGTPCCIYSEIPGMTGLDVGISYSGIGHMQGVFTFDRVSETKMIHAMAFDDIINSFESQIRLLQLPGTNKLEIYHIQLEYYGETGTSPDEYSFRPVWTFYGIADDIFPYLLKLYADTGNLCSQGA